MPSRKSAFNTVVLFGLLFLLFIAVAIEGTSDTLWTDEDVAGIITPTNASEPVCIGDTCTLGYELSVAHNASINGSPVCTAANGACPVANASNATGDGTGGWTNTSNTTSTNLTVNIRNTTYILKNETYPLKLEQHSSTVWTAPLEVMRLSATTSHTDNIMTGFGPRIVFEGDAGGGSHYDMGYLQYYYQYAANSIGRHWTGVQLVLQNEYGAGSFLNMAQYSSNSGTVAIGLGSSVVGQYGTAIGGAYEAGTGGVTIGNSNDNYGNSESAAIYGGTHNHDNGGSSVILGINSVYNGAASNIVIGNWLNPSAANTITIGSGAVGATQFGNNVPYSIRMGMNNLEYLWFKPTEFIFNGANQNLTFRIAEGNMSNAFTIQNSTGYVGLNTASPTQRLDVNGSGNFSGTNAQLFVNGSQVCTAANGLCATGLTANLTLMDDTSGGCWTNYAGGLLTSTNCT